MSTTLASIIKIIGYVDGAIGAAAAWLAMNAPETAQVDHVVIIVTGTIGTLLGGGLALKSRLAAKKGN